MSTPSLSNPLVSPTLARRLLAEALGTALLVAIVVGSGIRAEQLAAGNTALALLCNALATGAGLVALLISLGPVSGGHFNPAVTLAHLLSRRISMTTASGYIFVQLIGAMVGVVAAHAMFGLPWISMSMQARTGAPMWWSESLATFGLIGLGIATGRHRPAMLPFVVGGYIMAGYWFTSSTSFANPALTIACAFTDTFAGIRFMDVMAFIFSQIFGATNAVALFDWLSGYQSPRNPTQSSIMERGSQAPLTSVD